jgi:hypothetical protein
MFMRAVSGGVFALLIIFGLVRLGVPGELIAQEEQYRIQVLDEIQKHLPKDQADSQNFRQYSDYIRTEKQAAEQANQNAQQNVAIFRIVQIILTGLVVLLAIIVIGLILSGKTVDLAVKTFTIASATTILGFWFYVPK